MSVIYLNNFDKPIQHKVNGVKVIDSLNPDYDPGVWVTSPHPAQVHFGPMKTGESVPNTSVGSMTIEDPTTLPQFDPGGLVVEVDKNAAAPVAEIQSKTIYLVFPNLIIQGDGTLTAEVTFDLPEAVGGNPGDVWAVGLNFKYGDEDDRGTAIDFDFGPTCQFLDGGYVKLKQTTYVPPANEANGDPGTYVGFANYPPTEFTLSMNLVIGGGTLQPSPATLTFGNISHTGDVKVPAGFDLASVTAVGVAVVSTTNDLARFGARLHSFTLSATPLVFALR